METTRGRKYNSRSPLFEVSIVEGEKASRPGDIFPSSTSESCNKRLLEMTMLTLGAPLPILYCVLWRQIHSFFRKEWEKGVRSLIHSLRGGPHSWFPEKKRLKCSPPGIVIIYYSIWRSLRFSDCKEGQKRTVLRHKTALFCLGRRSWEPGYERSNVVGGSVSGKGASVHRRSPPFFAHAQWF